MSLRLHPLAKEDVPIILGFMEQYYKLDGLHFSPPEAEHTLRTLMDDPKAGTIWKILFNEETIGYAVLTFWYSLEFHGRSAFLDELFLIEAYRRRGLGTSVIEFLCAFCRKKNIHTLRLEVEFENRAARELYQRNGFEVHRRYIMTRRLS